jgi:hypothetical protein
MGWLKDLVDGAMEKTVKTTRDVYDGAQLVAVKAAAVDVDGQKGKLRLGGGLWYKISFYPIDKDQPNFCFLDFEFNKEKALAEFDRLVELYKPKI